MAKQKKLPAARNTNLTKERGPFKVQDVTISLTQREKVMFQLLKKTLQNNGLSDSVTLRVCGGWVRDKILQEMGKLDENHQIEDIDICIDTNFSCREPLLAVEFAKMVKKQIFEDTNRQWDEDLAMTGVGTMTKKVSNKGLDFAFMKVNGLKVDLMAITPASP